MRVLSVLTVVVLAGCPSTPPPTPAGPYRVPLDPASPWPKFRRDERQNARGDVGGDGPSAGFTPWVFRTGKGIFSSPVIAGDGTIYIGSADRNFYALNDDGTVRFTFPTGEIIDSAALLDDAGRVFFGSGDGTVYALDKNTGDLLWTFGADPPETADAFINWFEGNVAIEADGTLVIPNDNFFVYGVDRATGTRVWSQEYDDQTWSLPGIDVDAEAGAARMFQGNNNLLSFLSGNVFAWDIDGNLIWEDTTDGSVVASPLIVDDIVVIGSFDGTLRAWDRATGEVRWRFDTRDHIYASAALLDDRTLVQPSCDGSIYAIDIATGTARWAFDTGEPVRSSPAVDALGRVYVGNGEGKLFVLNPDGTLRFAMQLVEDARNDLNSSPALGAHGVVIAGESGEIFFVPWDWCLSDEGAADSRCILPGEGSGEVLPEGVTALGRTDALGGVHLDERWQVGPREAITLTLVARRDGDTVNAFLDSAGTGLTVTTVPAVDVDIAVSGDRRFVTLVPVTAWPADSFTLLVDGDVLEAPTREGLRFTGGTKNGSVHLEATLAVTSGTAASTLVPEGPTDLASVFELRRLAAPLPTLMPSYNQIGFDSLHFQVSLVRALPAGPDGAPRALAWLLGTLPDDDGDNVEEIIIDPATRAQLPLIATFHDGTMTLENRAAAGEGGMELEVMSLPLRFSRFRIDTAFDDAGNGAGLPRVVVSAVCDEIPTYGSFLRKLGVCNPDSDIMTVFGSVEVVAHEARAAADVVVVDGITAVVAGGAVVVTVDGDIDAAAHAVGVVVVDAVGEPVALDYGTGTRRESGDNGIVRTVTVGGALPAGALTAVLLVDGLPAASTAVVR